METSKFVELGKVQKIVLLITSLLFSLLLLFARTSLSSDQSLDQLARDSLKPEIAFGNGRPTVVEFYADWCEACQEMAPSLYRLKRDFQDEINVVLLNVDNDQWLDLIDKYEVNGIPQLNLFDSNGQLRGRSIGLKSQDQITQLVFSLVNNQTLPKFSGVRESDSSKILFSPLPDNVEPNYVGPRSHA